ncbi:MAG: hypothetical protein U5K81_04210 [Trueperaceae bacterium]|nr:hypothetical protein [Trueperaceae bacterium]
MARLEPLHQFICDTCGQVIENPDQGYVEWFVDPHSPPDHHGFSIVHHAPYSPRRESDRDCYIGRATGSLPLPRFLGQDGAAQRLAFLDLGPHHDPDRRNSPQARDLREYVEFLRRLTIPYYEEARLHWHVLQSQDYAGINETAIFEASELLRIIHDGEAAQR